MDINNNIVMDIIIKLQNSLVNLDNRMTALSDAVAILSSEVKNLTSHTDDEKIDIIGMKGIVHNTLPYGNLYQFQKGLLSGLIACGIFPYHLSQLTDIAIGDSNYYLFTYTDNYNQSVTCAYDYTTGNAKIM